MVKKLIEIFCFSKKKRIIKTGLARGMRTNYDLSHRMQHLMGLYEREIYFYLRRGIWKSKTLVDIGANDGYYLLSFLSQVDKDIIVCEPDDIYKELLFNAELNGFLRDKDFRLENKFVGNSESSKFIKMSTLLKDAVKPIFILVDIDGGEFDLLLSCGENFDFKKITWLFEVHSKELEENCITFLKNKGYKITIIKQAWWRILIPELRPLKHNRWFYAEY